MSITSVSASSLLEESVEASQTIVLIEKRSSDFFDIIQELIDLHMKKRADYGRDSDPLANVRASEDFSVPPWIGSMIRANDKMRRIQKAACGATLVNESLEDSLVDLALYTIIALQLFRENIYVNT